MQNAADQVTNVHSAATFVSTLGPRVVLIHPNDARRRWLANVSSASGFVVVTCDDGDAGLDRLAREHFDLAITAIQMPRLDGLELLRIVRHRLFRPPVIAVAGDSEVERAYLRCARVHGAEMTFCLPAEAGALVEGARDVLHDRWNGCSD